jgi:phosphohistidine phosphatase
MIMLILIRHAKPADPHEYASDFDRPLVDEGRVVQREMAERLKSEGYVPSHILTSPFLRARQTADILCEVLEAPVQEEEGLGQPFDAEAVLAAVGEGTTMLVGHVPTMPQMVNLLIGRHVLDSMAKSSAAIVTFKETPAFGAGKLVDYITPD